MKKLAQKSKPSPPKARRIPDIDLVTWAVLSTAIIESLSCANAHAAVNTVSSVMTSVRRNFSFYYSSWESRDGKAELAKVTPKSPRPRKATAPPPAQKGKHHVR